MRVVVAGAAGLLAAAVGRELSPRHEVVALDRRALDITDAAAVARVLAETAPDAVINCAAYNDVDGAEDDAVAALQINAFAVRSLARAARAANAAFVHYSTDFVFDGSASAPYTEDDAPNPRGVYGASKLLGEWFALEAPASYVLRVESLFGPAGANGRRGSVDTIVARIRAGEQVPVFTDRTVSPTYTVDAARATAALLERHAPPGVYHCVNSGTTTWIEVAAEAARLLGLPLNTRPITLDSVALRAPRPRYCAMSNARLAAAGVTMPAWREALADYLRPAA